MLCVPGHERVARRLGDQVSVSHGQVLQVDQTGSHVPGLGGKRQVSLSYITVYVNNMGPLPLNP